jgi:alkylhydroperoxidase/carboxymuconolactone decarboxylase family protein YurZ
MHSWKQTNMTEKNPYEIFEKECPELADRFNNFVEVPRSLKSLDPKTKQLINSAIQTSTRSPRGVRFHVNHGTPVGGYPG